MYKIKLFETRPEAAPLRLPLATAMDSDVLTESLSRHPLISLVSACFWVIRESWNLIFTMWFHLTIISVWLLSWFKALVAFATITVPRCIYSILSYSMTLTVSFTFFLVSLLRFLSLRLHSWGFGTLQSSSSARPSP